MLLCAVAISAISKPAYAQTGQVKILASDGAASDEFGYSVSISGDSEKAIDAGMNDHLGKPIDPEELFRTLTHWIKPRPLS